MQPRDLLSNPFLVLGLTSVIRAMPMPITCTASSSNSGQEEENQEEKEAGESLALDGQSVSGKLESVAGTRARSLAAPQQREASSESSCLLRLTISCCREA